MLEKTVYDQDIKGAYIFFGPQGIGKVDFALFFARSFLCGVIPYCGFCSECRYEVHPDILLVKKGADDERLKAETIRFALDFSLIPPYSFHKFIIIQNAHQMTQQGFSALLKALEESKPYVTFILTTSKPAYIPPTILSRCIKVRLFPKINEFVEMKVRERNFSDEIKKIALNISYFNFSVLEKDEAQIERIWKILRCVVSPDSSKAEYLKLIDEIRESEEAFEILDALESYLVRNSEKLGRSSVELWDKIKSAREKLELFINPKIVLLSLIF